MKDKHGIIGGEFTIDIDRIMRLKSMVSSNGDIGRRCSESGEEDKCMEYTYSLGRSALHAIIKSLKQGGKPRVGVPDYICASVITIVDSVAQSVFYHIEGNLLPDNRGLQFLVAECDAVILVNYFGLLDLSEAVKVVRNVDNHCVIIIDDVQNYYGFGKEPDFDFVFNSHRKWFAVPDGADVISRMGTLLEQYEKENRFAVYKVSGNVLKNLDGVIDDNVCLELIEKGEDILDGDYTVCRSEISERLMQMEDISDTAKVRKENAKYLHEGLYSLGISHLYRSDVVPMFVPIFVNNRDAIRRSLFDDNIFCPVHWPRVPGHNWPDNPLYDTELSLICDQRYGSNDMKRILEVLENGCENM